MSADELDLAAIRARAQEAASTSELSVRITNTDPYTTLALVQRVEDAEAEVERLRDAFARLAAVAAVLDEWQQRGHVPHPDKVLSDLRAVLGSDPAEVVAGIKADDPEIDVRYVETQFDRIAADPDERPNVALVWGLPFHAEYDGLRVAATSPESAREMILTMLARRAEVVAGGDGRG